MKNNECDHAWSRVHWGPFFAHIAGMALQYKTYTITWLRRRTGQRRTNYTYKAHSGMIKIISITELGMINNYFCRISDGLASYQIIHKPLLAQQVLSMQPFTQSEVGTLPFHMIGEFQQRRTALNTFSLYETVRAKAAMTIFQRFDSGWVMAKSLFPADAQCWNWSSFQMSTSDRSTESPLSRPKLARHSHWQQFQTYSRQ